jgi:hypothetical protein
VTAPPVESAKEIVPELAMDFLAITPIHLACSNPVDELIPIVPEVIVGDSVKVLPSTVRTTFEKYIGSGKVIMELA